MPPINPGYTGGESKHSNTGEGTTGSEDDSSASLLDGSDLIVVSNRQPYRFEYDEHEEVNVDRPAGGLTAGLDPVVQRTGGTWVAWSDGEADAIVTDDDWFVRVPRDDPEYELKLIPLSESEVKGYYYGYSNQVLWPICHGGIWQAEFAECNWETYQDVNRKFADAILDCSPDNAIIWFQDYHFTRAPRHIQDATDDAFLMHFWHITWPGWDTFRALPHRNQIVSGLLGNDLIGFHTDQYLSNFLDCVERTLDSASVDEKTGTIQYRNRTITVRSFPLSVDAQSFGTTANSLNSNQLRELTKRFEIPTSSQIALGVDRLDYTKGIPERIKALEQFWSTHPEWQGELTYVQKADESRSIIPNYKDLQKRVDDAIARVNDRFGTPEWQPIIRIDEFLPQEQLIGLYYLSDLMLVSPLRDGMNLVAKEYVVSQVENDGVLLLSDQAGATQELGDDALSINPHNIMEFANAIERAVTLSEGDRQERMKRMRECIHDYDLDAWMNDILETALDLRADIDEGVND